jgi:hypothetical protein
MSAAKPPQVKEPPPLQSTRQMLDELDALMDRMLAIPVNDVDDSAPAVPAAPAVVRMPTVSATLTVLEEPLEDEETPTEPAPPEASVREASVREASVREASVREASVREASVREASVREASVPLRQSFPSYATEPAPGPEDQGPLPALIEPPPFRPASAVSRSEPAPLSVNVIPPPIRSITALTNLPSPPTSPAPPLELVRLPRRSLAGRCLLPLVWLNHGFDQSTRLLGGPGRWLRGSAGRQLLGLTGLGLLAAAGAWLIKDWLGWPW